MKLLILTALALTLTGCATLQRQPEPPQIVTVCPSAISPEVPEFPDPREGSEADVTQPYIDWLGDVLYTWHLMAGRITDAKAECEGRYGE